MKDNLNKIGVFTLYGLLGVSVLLTVLFYAGILSEMVLINWGYILLGIAAVAAVAFPVLLLAQNPKKAKGALLSLLGLLIVFGLGYVLAGDAVIASYEPYGVDAFTSKFVGTGMIATYVLLALSGGSIVFFGVMSWFKG